MLARALTTTADAGVPVPVRATEHAFREAEGIFLGADRSRRMATAAAVAGPAHWREDVDGTGHFIALANAC